MTFMRPLQNSEIESVLARNHLGHLGCMQHGTPYVYPMAYAFKDDILYGQTSVGLKVELLRSHAECCFQVEQIGSNSWESVQCWGVFEELDITKLQASRQKEIAQLLSKKLGAVQEQFGLELKFDWESKHSQSNTLWRLRIVKAAGIAKEW